jgi:hypothetical protein
MQGSEDRLNFESDFGFLLFWFDDFRRVDFCCFGLMDGFESGDWAISANWVFVVLVFLI